MAKGFIDAPQDGEGMQWSECMGPSRQNTQVTQTGQGGIARPTPVTPEDEHTDDGTISSASSQENLPPLSSSSAQTSQQQPAASPLGSSPVPFRSVYSPHFQASSPTLPSQTDQSAASSSSHVPTIPSSSSQIPSQLTWSSTPPYPGVQSSPVHSPPYPSAQQASSISVEELHELAIQDSANNNVDENSNEQYDRYANANYHQDFAPMQYNPDPSVRPRVRRGAAGAVRGEEVPDCAPQMRPGIEQRPGSGEGEGYRFSHRRNLSDGHPCTSRGYRRDSITDYPPLPNLNTSTGGESVRPRVPNLHPSSSVHCHRRGEWVEERSRWLPMSLRGGGYGPPPNPEDTNRGAQELLINFTADVLRSHHLDVPNDIREQGGFSNPAFSMAGRELRMLADNFATTEERRRVRCMAETVNMSSMTMENFFLLCAELFSDGITRERIVALFTFVGDVAVHQVLHRGDQFLRVLLSWSLKYLVDHVCRWVQDAGGWVNVLTRGANIMYQTAVFAFCVCGTLAAGLFIYKTLKDW